ncbi:MAG: carbon-nitrogen hydrolase [Candidatus Latescibacteria bacterium]|nr:carbon-nitrogen hydrolase [Candidatus Latescibacterota bacterium]
MSCSPDPAVNLKKTSARIREAAEKGAQIVCLQELYRTQYFCRSEDYDNFSFAETIPGQSTEEFSEIAREKCLVVIAPLFEKRAEGIYHNSAVVIDADGTLLGTYRKMHIPDDPGFYEKFYFTPGDRGFVAFQTRYATVGVLICWDQWYPEAARLTALKGAQILFYPTAIGWAAHETPKVRQAQLSAWEIVQRSHSVTNGVFVASANRVGREGELEFWGNSFVSNPFGELLAKAKQGREETLIVGCDLSQIEFYRVHWPFLRDRRIDAYDLLTERYLET